MTAHCQPDPVVVSLLATATYYQLAPYLAYALGLAIISIACRCQGRLTAKPLRETSTVRADARLTQGTDLD
jgi:hypothetical protein